MRVRCPPVSYTHLDVYKRQMYNSAVEEVFFELNEERILRFRPFCTQVKLMYLNFADKDWSQGKIFEKMVDWLQNATNEDRNSCEVIISYFIRKCEVFDVITCLLYTS